MYKYETHLHTCEASACGVTSGAEYPAYYQSMGYSGIFITDHFFNGNCRVPKLDNWEERVNLYCKGYEAAKAAGDKIGFPVYFGIEANFAGDEFLLYGLSKEWLLEHSDVLSYSRTRLYNEVKLSGGLVVQAHPFRERDYLSCIQLNPETCDAMEAYNSSNEPYQNGNADLYCRTNDIFMTAGSDLHRIGALAPEQFFGMEFNYPINKPSDYVQAILNREGHMTVADSDRVETSSIITKLPVITYHRES